jgi:chlorite dismutase
MFDVLKSLPIPIELGAFVFFALIFLVFRAREMSAVNATLAKIADNNNSHNKGIADEFQGIVRDMNRDFRASQKNYQEQLQSLTDSHIKVSRESINMLNEIKIGFRDIEHAFRNQSSKFASIEDEVRNLKQGRLEGPPESSRPLPPG